MWEALERRWSTTHFTASWLFRSRSMATTMVDAGWCRSAGGDATRYSSGLCGPPCIAPTSGDQTEMDAGDWAGQWGRETADVWEDGAREKKEGREVDGGGLFRLSSPAFPPLSLASNLCLLQPFSHPPSTSRT